MLGVSPSHRLVARVLDTMRVTPRDRYFLVLTIAISVTLLSQAQVVNRILEIPEGSASQNRLQPPRAGRSIGHGGSKTFHHPVLINLKAVGQGNVVVASQDAAGNREGLALPVGPVFPVLSDLGSCYLFLADGHDLARL